MLQRAVQMAPALEPGRVSGRVKNDKARVVGELVSLLRRSVTLKKFGLTNLFFSINDIKNVVVRLTTHRTNSKHVVVRLKYELTLI